ncbi:MAG: hypothetical protein ACI9GB_002956 [Halioglobus sp.]|jgi:hypothetical protein
MMPKSQFNSLANYITLASDAVTAAWFCSDKTDQLVKPLLTDLHTP